ncbi:hypothetical protein EJ08DRAFT_703983 [Tothia fuscella]|uniref:Uncharacterized protein n=1 Tax=Tothia fuscella TaxID=1048955 RepID=A0A9P4NDF0_9PEZI|nr:hypothetical protein EJ08DRAFT_703983 [Tothia fuscella]
MATSKQVEMSLLTEHLRYTPLTLLDDIINSMNEISFRLVNAAEQGLLSADPGNLGFAQKAESENIIPDADGEGQPIYTDAKPEIEEGVHKLETLLESNVDKNFDKLELYVLRGPLHVPEELVPWVRLGHYEVGWVQSKWTESIYCDAKQQQNLSLPDPNSTIARPTPETIQQLRRQLQETRKLNSALRASAKRNTADLEQLRSLLIPSTSSIKNESSSSPSRQSNPPGAFSFLTHSNGAKSLGITPVSTDSASKNPTTGPLETNTSFTLSQLPALRALLDALRPKLAGLGDASTGPREDEAARERRIYIENQTRKALERRGVEIQGDADATGRRIGPDELAALESISESLGANDRMEE